MQIKCILEKAGHGRYEVEDGASSMESFHKEYAKVRIQIYIVVSYTMHKAFTALLGNQTCACTARSHMDMYVRPYGIVLCIYVVALTFDIW